MLVERCRPSYRTSYDLRVASRSLPILAVLLAAVLALAGCASGGRSAGGSAGGPRAVPARFQPMQVTAVRALDATDVRVTVQVPAPTSSCVHGLAGRVTDSDARSVFVQITYGSPSSAVGTCAETALASVVVAVPALRGRQFSIDSENAPWAAQSGSPDYRHCTGAFGCAPPPHDHCNAAWTQLAGHSGELQPERSFRVLGCDQTWLVMNIDATVTGCQTLDGARAPAGCRVQHVRWFFRFRASQGWMVVASSGRAGCSGVHATVPAFPSGLCRTLPAR